jgi:hypothetical protein
VDSLMTDTIDPQMTEPGIRFSRLVKIRGTAHRHFEHDLLVIKLRRTNNWQQQQETEVADDYEDEEDAAD